MSNAATQNDFRQEVKLRFPNLKCTLKRQIYPTLLKMECIQSRGFNRVVTICVIKRLEHKIPYTVTYAGFGKKAAIKAKGEGETLAQAIEALIEAMSTEDLKTTRFYNTFNTTAIQESI